jgi:hypothetical protein
MMAYASRSHYLAHIAPVYDALRRPKSLAVTRDLSGHPLARDRGAGAVRRGVGPCIVAGYADLFRARRLGYGPFVLMQHGAGQSYNGDPRSAGNHSYAGAKGHEDVALFIVPGPDPAARWQAAYPRTPVVMAGNLRPLPEKASRDRTIAVTFHWPCGLIPEAGTAWPEYRDALPALLARWHVLGHWHPRWGSAVRDWYVRHGIEPVESLTEVALRADVLVADNTSALYEFAATGRPVVVMDSRRYRRDVHHGLRFWSASYVGVRVDDPRDLADAIGTAYMDPPGLRADRRAAVGMVYSVPDLRGAAEAIAAM